MPIYEYVCESCGKVTEKIARVGEETTECACGKVARKKISVPSAGVVSSGHSGGCGMPGGGCGGGGGFS